MHKKFLLFTIVLILSTGVVFAASGDSMTIGGVVPLVLDLALTQDAGADDLDLDSADTATTAVIADLIIETNSTAGWELVVMSENESELVNVELDPIAYTLIYAIGTNGSSTSTGAQTLTSTGVIMTQDTDRTASGTPEDGTLTIGYTRSTDFPAGYYSDLLTVTLRAK